MFFIQQDGDGDGDTGQQTDKIHEVENAELSFFVATKGWLISNVFYMGLKNGDSFYYRIHGFRALGLSIILNGEFQENGFSANQTRD